jgi:hypothetical protein
MLKNNLKHKHELSSVSVTLRTAHIPIFHGGESIGCSSAELQSGITRPAFTDDVTDRVENAVITSLTCQ